MAANGRLTGVRFPPCQGGRPHRRLRWPAPRARGSASPFLLVIATAQLMVVLEGPPRDRAMGVYAGMSVAGGAVGLIAGGLLTTYLSWR